MTMLFLNFSGTCIEELLADNKMDISVTNLVDTTPPPSDGSSSPLYSPDSGSLPPSPPSSDEGNQCFQDH
jgi:hypothetical protein